MRIKEKLLEAIGCGPGSAAAAKIIVPEIEKLFKATSVADIGCGNGTFLKEFHCPFKFGYDKIKKFLDAEICFFQVDLESGFEPLKSVDVALCLEVAEHIGDTSARVLIKDLVKASRIVIFSAAIPFQGGLHHVNEQWPSYWAGLFADNDYLVSTYLLDKFWNEKLAPWYHLIYIYGTKETLDAYNLKPYTGNLDIVHPSIWTEIGLMGIAKRLKLW